MKRIVVAHHQTILASIERTRQRIRLMECNGAPQQALDEERRRLIKLRKQLPWMR